MTKITKAKQLELNGRILTRKLLNNLIKEISAIQVKNSLLCTILLPFVKTHVGISEYAKNSL